MLADQFTADPPPTVVPVNKTVVTLDVQKMQVIHGRALHGAVVRGREIIPLLDDDDLVPRGREHSRSDAAAAP
jgi:hypothetical protein